MKRMLKVAGVLSLFALTAQSCGEPLPGGPGVVVGPGPGIGRVGACFTNSRAQTAWYRVEWLDGTGRVRVFAMAPFSRRRVFIGRRVAQWCWSFQRPAVTQQPCLRPLRVVNNC